METKQLTKEIEELKKQKESLIDKRSKIEDDFEQSEKWKILSEEINKLEKDVEVLQTKFIELATMYRDHD